jgi:hypothetical protein
VVKKTRQATALKDDLGASCKKKRVTRRNPDHVPMVDATDDLGASTVLPKKKKKKRKTDIEPTVEEVHNPGPSSLPPQTDNDTLESSTTPTLLQKEITPKSIPEISDEPSRVIPSLEVEDLTSLPGSIFPPEAKEVVWPGGSVRTKLPWISDPEDGGKNLLQKVCFFFNDFKNVN